MTSITNVYQNALLADATYATSTAYAISQAFRLKARFPPA
jgi:hypothetical protein